MIKILLVCVLALKIAFAFAVESLQENHNQNVIRQKFEESCGAASLATLLNLFGIQQYQEQEILNVLNQKTDMLSFQELQKAATILGYDTKGFQLSREVLQRTAYPLLVRIENDPRFPHFVVIINFKGDFLKVLDPNFGEYISTKKEFYSIWDRNHTGGYALVVTNKENSKPLLQDLKFPSEVFFGK
nr:cysteine peptidase family C39 domain-containing protein [Helicobacter sp.]